MKSSTSTGRRRKGVQADPRDRGRQQPLRVRRPTARPPAVRDAASQAPLTDEGLMAGLEELARALARRHPGRRFIFEAGPGDDRAGLVVGREVWWRLTAPEDPHAPIVDRNGLGPAWAADIANKDAADHRD